MRVFLVYNTYYILHTSILTRILTNPPDRHATPAAARRPNAMGNARRARSARRLGWRVGSGMCGGLGGGLGLVRKGMLGSAVLVLVLDSG